MNILVTGGGGSAGSYLLERLVQDFPKDRIYALYRRRDEKVQRNLRTIADQIIPLEADLCNMAQLQKIFSQTSFDQIYHLASEADVLGSFHHPVQVLNNNILSTANLLETLRQFKQNPRFLMCSTSEVYGRVSQDKLPLTEESAFRPASPYSVSKLCQDQLGQVYYQAFGLSVITTRMFTYLNPRRENLFATAFALQVAEIEAGLRTELVHGNLDSVRTFIDFRDAMSAYILAMAKGQPGEAYNISGEEVASVGEFLEVLKSKAKVPIPTRQDSSLLRPVDVTLQIADSSKFKSVTGWRPKYSLEESVEHLLNECRKQVVGQ